MSFNYNFEDDNPENPGYGAKYDPEQSLIQPDSTITPKEEKLRSRPKPKTHEELLQSFYDVKEKAPEVDQAKIDRLRRMGRLNQLAQGTKVLADIAGTAMGANVRKRQPDSTAPALFQSYQNTLDKYKDQTDAYNLRDFSVKRQNAQLGLQRADKETAQEFANRRQAAIEKNNEAKTALENSKFLLGLKQKQQQIDNLKAYQEARLKIDKEKLKIGKNGSSDKSKQPITIKTAKKTYTLSPAEASYTRGKAIENIDLLKKKYPTWTITVPKLDEWNEIIPGEFTTKLDPRIKDDDLIRAQKQLEEDEQELKDNPESKTTTSTPSQTNTSPKATTAKSLDYSKIY